MTNKALEPMRHWLKDNGISVALYYALPEDDRPPTVKLGSKVFIVLDQIPDWTAKVSAKGQVTTSRTAQREVI